MRGGFEVFDRALGRLDDPFFPGQARRLGALRTGCELGLIGGVFGEGFQGEPGGESLADGAGGPLDVPEGESARVDRGPTRFLPEDGENLVGDAVQLFVGRFLEWHG